MDLTSEPHLSLDCVFLTTLPRQCRAKSSVLTQPHSLFLHSEPSKCWSGLRFHTIQGGLGCLSQIIHIWLIQLLGIILMFKQKLFLFIVLTLACFFGAPHTARQILALTCLK